MREGEERARGLAKGLRRRMTDAETILWSRLRHDSIRGMRFRRQHPIGPYIADFACIPANLIVEVDGATHGSDEEVTHDRKRDAYLRKSGWRVVRIRNEDVYQHLDDIVDMIFRLIPPPSAAAVAASDTSPAGGGGSRTIRSH